jgi:type IV secretory pathway VirB4 component
LVIGKTGSGKSTCTKLLGTNFILNPRYRKIFFIDPENEYTKMVKNYDGDVIDCSGQVNSGRINPFHIYMAGDEEGNATNDRYMA